MSTDTMPHARLEQTSTRQGDRGGGRQPGARQPGRWWLLMVAGAMAMLVAAGWGLSAVTGMIDDVEGWQRAAVPGEVEVHVDEPGEMVVRSESLGAVRWGAPERPSDALVVGPQGEPVTVSEVGFAGEYRVPGRTGRPVATFDAGATGSHRVSVEGRTADDVGFAVGEPLWPQTLGGVAGAGTLGMAGLIALTAGAIGYAVEHSRRADGETTSSRQPSR